MTAVRTLKVLTSDPKGPVVRHRVLAFESALRAVGISLEIVPWPKGFFARRKAFARFTSSDAVLISSRLLPVRILGRFRSRVARLLFDFDDALPCRDTARGASVSATRARRFRAIVRAADAVSAGNPWLAGLAGQEGVAAAVLPTVVSVEPGPPAPEPAPPPYVLGWIGSKATVGYLHAAMIPLAAVVAAGRPFRLRVVSDVPPVMPPGIPVEHVPWSPTAETLALDGIHAGIAPLPDDPWTRGKCGLKVLQMLARGRPVVASPVGVQTQQVRHGETGFLAATREQWVEAVLALLAEPDLRRRMGEAAREDVRARWSVAAWAPRVVAHFEKALS